MSAEPLKKWNIKKVDEAWNILKIQGPYLCKTYWPGFGQSLMMVGLLILGVVIETSGTAAEPASAINNLMQLCRLADSEPTLTSLMNLNGTVLWSSEAEGTLILQDNSGITQLELDFACPMPRQGDRVRLTGDCTVVKIRDAIKLSSIPVVENDGLHVMTEESGSVYLTAGRHPIRVDWFNRTDKYGLEVEYAGPNLPRQRVPDEALFQTQSDSANEATNFVNGLDYRDYEGLWWSLLPNFNHLPPVKTGVTSNFDLKVESRVEHVGLQFSGYLQIAKEGRYTFYTTSDDGSRLFIGDSSLQVNVTGKTALPRPHQVVNGSTDLEPEEYEWSEIKGTVISVNRLADTLEVELATDSGSVLMKVAENSDSSFALVPQNRILAVGVRRKILHLDGTKALGEFFVQNWRDIEQNYVTPNLWAAYPILTIQSALAASGTSNPQPVVHLQGNIIQTGAGQPTFLEDGSGRIALETSGAGDPGRDPMELLGRVGVAGTNLVLRCGLFRRVGEATNGTGTLPVLTTAEQVNELNTEELNRGYPVKLRGVITAALWGDAIVLQDPTRGIFVKIGKPNTLQPGDYCEVDGIAMPGEFTPFVMASRINNLGTGVLPNPVRPTWDQFLNGSLQNQYVELEGVVTMIKGDTITLLTPDGRIKVGLFSPNPVLPMTWKNALVCLRGCILISWDKQTRRVDVGRVYLNQSWVSVVQPAPTDLFALPTKRVDDLLRFDPQAGALQRVKVSGQVIHVGKTGCFLLDGSSGLKFIPAETPAVQPGDLVDVVGFPKLSGASPFIQEAEVRRRGAAVFPTARKLEADHLIRDDFDSTLVQVDGMLLAANGTPEGYVLEMQNGPHRFIATVNEVSGIVDLSLAPGSKLELTGVYVGQGGNRVLGQPIDSFQLLLNSGFDIRVLSHPPWWTLRRLLTALGLLAGVLTAALVWIQLLQRKVIQRTVLLESQIQQRQRAERQREIEHERARVAQDLHDDLGAGLTRVNVLTSLVGSPATSGEAKTQYLADLKVMARDMVTSLDEIVWSVNPRNDTVVSLVGYFGAHAQGLLALASVKCGLDVAEDLPDLPLDSKFRHEVLMAFKEAITNVIRHSGATKVWLRIRVEGEVLILEVVDNGRGFVFNQPMEGADGLSNMQERLSNLGGCCKIQSKPGEGTTIRFEARLPKTSISL